MIPVLLSPSKDCYFCVLMKTRGCPHNARSSTLHYKQKEEVERKNKTACKGISPKIKSLQRLDYKTTVSPATVHSSI